MNGSGNCKVKITAAMIHKVNENPFSDSLVCEDKAMSDIPMIHRIPAQEESEKRSPIRMIEAPEMDNNLKLFFIVIGFCGIYAG